MCSIEEAWAGQLFENRRVQSQADLHRKYMPISDNLLERNNEFSIGRNEPQSREGTRGMNTKFLPQTQNHAVGDGSLASVNFDNNRPPVSNYGGLNPRPSYMSIYDNADANPQASQPSQMPMPSMTTMGGKDNFNDINQAFTVSKTVDRFMNMHQQSNQDNFDDVNVLLNEDNELDKRVLQKKFKMVDNNNYNQEQFNNASNASYSSNTDNIQFRKTLQDVLMRLDRLENKMQHQNTRNMYDMVLYILVGMLISFIIYSILRK
jgi:hypothetical protein